MKKLFNTEINEKKYSYFVERNVACYFEHFFKELNYKTYRFCTEDNPIIGYPKLSFWFFKLLLEAKYDYKFDLKYKIEYNYTDINCGKERVSCNFGNGGKYKVECEELGFGIIFKDDKFFLANCFLRDAWEQQYKITYVLNRKQEFKHRSTDAAEKEINIKYQLMDITKIINSVNIFNFDDFIKFIDNILKKLEMFYDKNSDQRFCEFNYCLDFFPDFFKSILNEKEFKRISYDIKQNIIFSLQNT